MTGCAEIPINIHTITIIHYRWSLTIVHNPKPHIIYKTGKQTKFIIVDQTRNAFTPHLQSIWDCRLGEFNDIVLDPALFKTHHPSTKMSDYSSKKVAELKELLAARGLAVSGNKADLVTRLVDADKAAPTASDETTVQETVQATEVVETTATDPVPAAVPEVSETITVTETDAPSSTVPAEATVTLVEDDVVEAVPEVSDEEKQKQAIENLEKQIKRKKRFATGDSDADIADLEKQLDRIKRFGYAAATAPTGLSLDGDLDSLKKGRGNRREGGKTRRESVTTKEKDAAHPYKKGDSNGLKAGVKLVSADEEKIKARQSRFA